MPDSNYPSSGGFQKGKGSDSLKSGPGKGNRNEREIKPGSSDDPLRSMPLNADAERAALSCMLMDPSNIIPIAIEKMSPGFFYIPAHHTIYECLLHLYKSRPGGALDLIVLSTELDQRGQLDSVGGPKALADLLDDVITLEGLNHAWFLRTCSHSTTCWTAFSSRSLTTSTS